MLISFTKKQDSIVIEQLLKIVANFALFYVHTKLQNIQPLLLELSSIIRDEATGEKGVPYFSFLKGRCGPINSFVTLSFPPKLDRMKIIFFIESLQKHLELQCSTDWWLCLVSLEETREHVSTCNIGKSAHSTLKYNC